MAAMHVSLSAEPIFAIGSVVVTNSMLTSTFISALLIIIALYANKIITNTKKPKGLQNFLEAIVDGLYNLVSTTTENTKKTLAIFPWVASFFLVILINNWFGLLPGVGTINVVYTGEPPQLISILSNQAHAASPALTSELKEHIIPLIRPGTADLNMTIALALTSVVMIQMVGVQFLGLAYFSKFFNLNGINSFVGLLELVSEVSKIISFAFRLFGNIFAGEVLLTVILFLTPLLLPLPFIGLEIFVGFIQALVFAMLTMVFMTLATQSHDADH